MIQLSILAMILGVVMLVALPPARTRLVHNSMRGMGGAILAAGAAGCLIALVGVA
jgi:hypothetical protein